MDSHIWCHLCDKVQPLELGNLDPTEKWVNAVDLMCGDCGLVLATMYTPRPETPSQRDGQ